MATPVFENKVRRWEQSRIEAAMMISRYPEQQEYFAELERMAFSSLFKKKEMDERILSLKSFALSISGKEPELSAQLNTFLPLCETLFGDAEFKATAKRLGLASVLLAGAEREAEEVRAANARNAMRGILEKDYREWNGLRRSFAAEVAPYEAVQLPFWGLMFMMSGHIGVSPADFVRRMQLFSNQISGKDSNLGSRVQKYAALSGKYLSDTEKLRLFREELRKRGDYAEIDRFYQDFQRADEAQRAEEARRKAEEARRQAEREARERRQREEQERQRREAAERQRREAEERERRRRMEEARRIERERKARVRRKVMRFLLVACILIGVVVFGMRAVQRQHTARAFTAQLTEGDHRLAEKQYRLAIEEYRKAMRIDPDKQAQVADKIAQAERAEREEFDKLLAELETILKADRNFFNEDSDKRLDRMLEISPEREECKRYQQMRQRQKGKRG